MADRTPVDVILPCLDEADVSLPVLDEDRTGWWSIVPDDARGGAAEPNADPGLTPPGRNATAGGARTGTR